LTAAPVTYELDPRKTELLAITAPGGLPGAGHPHVVAATKVTGKIVYDAEAPEKSSVTVTFPTDGLRADDNALRRREGMSDMSDGTREGVNNNMREDDQLSPELFPSVSFASTAVKGIGNGQLEVKGKLSIRGVEKDITIPVSIRVKGDEFVGTGSLLIRHSDFKFKPYSAALGAVKNLDEIGLKITLVGRAQAQEKAAAP
jgi:polyisoprenoid-binding protein YceI